jgi:type III secretion system-like peptide-binding chaperone
MEDICGFTGWSIFDEWALDGRMLEGPLSWFAAAAAIPFADAEDISVDWLAFVLEQLLLEDRCILIVQACADHCGFVQFLAHDDHLHAETKSNAYMDDHDRLNAAEVSHLLGLGWQEPARSHDDEGPGSPNFHRAWDAPVPIDAVAQLAVRTLNDIYGETAPSRLTVRFLRTDEQSSVESTCST